LVFGDEPTGNLDAHTEAKVLDLLADLFSAQGRTLVIVTHSPVVARLANRVLVLDAGHLSAASPPGLPPGPAPAWAQPFSRTLFRIRLRYLVRHPWQAWLSLAGIALVVAVDLASQSARRAFGLSVERVAGRATHRIEGAGKGIPDAVYAALHLELGIRPASRVVEGQVVIQGRTFTLLGLDLLASQPCAARFSGA
jgi:energy-coupling factor transporter ATP-binding protein EcfA2